MRISDSRVIITGAGSGFGRAITSYFASQGAKIAAIDIHEPSLLDLKKENPEIQTWVCNVADNNQVEKTVDEIFSQLSGIEVLINNAGIMKNAPLINFLNRKEPRHSLDLWRQVISVNQDSVFYMTRACANLMIAKRCKGVIVNISSISAKGNAGQTAYSASKAAVEAMTKVWAKELGRFSIRSVAIAPGFMDTAGTKDALEEKMLTQWIEKIPLRRTGTVDEVVKTVKFAVENDFVNGEVININGGLTI